ncbi:MAG: hypothetical protein JSR73_16540 [Proteobacteria bacterium]|nr:hypothetical protein [Pseudomonadota bacterium]
MSRRRQAELAARRAVLAARSTRLRASLATDAAALAVRFQFADRALAVARAGGGRALLFAAAALMLFGRPRRVLGVAARLLALLPIAMPLWPLAKRLLAGHGRDPASA